MVEGLCMHPVVSDMHNAVRINVSYPMPDFGCSKVSMHELRMSFDSHSTHSDVYRCSSSAAPTPNGT